MEGPESVGVELLTGARRVVVRESVVIEELVNDGLKGIKVVVNIVFEIPQEQAEGVGEVLVHLIQTTIHGLMNIQVVTKGTIDDSRIRNQWKTHLKRVL